MIKNPETTVFVTAYNYGRFLAECIESILSQSYTDYELLICDNASTDNTQEVVMSYDDPRINYIRHNENIGPFANGLQAIDMAKGAYIHPFCADDIMLPDLLCEQVEMMKRNPYVGVVSCDMIMVNEDLTTSELIEFHRGYTSGKKVIDSCLGTMQNKVGGPSQHLFRKALLSSPAYSKEYRFLSDLKAVLDVLRESDYASIDRPGVIYRRHPQSDTNTGCKSALLRSDNWFRLIKEYNAFTPSNIDLLLKMEISKDFHKELLQIKNKLSLKRKAELKMFTIGRKLKRLMDLR